MTRYHVLCSDELMARSDLRFPRGLRPIEQEPTDPARYPGMHWWLFSDRGAPASLEGKRVELTLTDTYQRPFLDRLLRRDRPPRKVPVISERREMP